MARFPSCHLSGSRGASIPSMGLDVRRRTTSIIMSPVDFCDGNFSITFTSIPILFFFLFPFFPPAAVQRGAALLVSISDSNLMASWYLSHDLPIPISRYRPPLDDDGFRLARHHSRDPPKVPRTPRLSERDDDGMRNSREGPSGSTKFLGIQLLLLRCVARAFRIVNVCEENTGIGIF